MHRGRTAVLLLTGRRQTQCSPLTPPFAFLPPQFDERWCGEPGLHAYRSTSFCCSHEEVLARRHHARSSKPPGAQTVSVTWSRDAIEPDHRSLLDSETRSTKDRGTSQAPPRICCHVVQFVVHLAQPMCSVNTGWSVTEVQTFALVIVSCSVSFLHDKNHKVITCLHVCVM